jgi:hypothetical protein
MIKSFLICIGLCVLLLVEGRSQLSTQQTSSAYVYYHNSLGIQLIRLFSEQLEGDLYFINNNGLEVTLNFKAPGYHDTTISKIIA